MRTRPKDLSRRAAEPLIEGALVSEYAAIALGLATAKFSESSDAVVFSASVDPGSRVMAARGN
jgi:hypothetical protein